MYVARRFETGLHEFEFQHLNIQNDFKLMSWVPSKCMCLEVGAF